MNSKQNPARDRIVQVACDLFYKQGYLATGINEVIGKSGVAKATFYNHFPSKDDLCLECLGLLRRNEITFIENALSKAKGPLERFMSVIVSLEPWAVETKFRGCAFMNIASEIPDPRSPLRKEGKKLYDDIRRRVEQLATELQESDAEQYGHLDVQTLTDDYMLAFAGAVALAEVYHAIKPIKQAVQTVKQLIGH